MSTLSLPDLIGVSVADSRCLLTSAHLLRLGGLILRLSTRDQTAVCFLGGELTSLADKYPDTAVRLVALDETLGPDPFLVLAGAQGTLALLAVAAPGGYQARLFSNPDQVDSAALVLAQFAGVEYGLNPLADSEARRGLVATVVAALVGSGAFQKLPLADLLPDDQAWLRVGEALVAHADRASCLRLPPVVQMLRACGGEASLIGQAGDEPGPITVLATTEGLATRRVTLPADTLAQVRDHRRPASLPVGEVRLDETEPPWLALTLAPLVRGERVVGLLLVGSTRPLPGPARATLHGLGVLLAGYLHTAASAPPAEEPKPELAPEPASEPVAVTTPTERLQAPATGALETTAGGLQTLIGARVPLVSEMPLLPLLEHLGDGVLLIDEQGALLAYNGPAARLLALNGTELGQPLAASPAGSPAEALVPLLTDALLGEQHAPRELELASGQRATAHVLPMAGDRWAFVLRAPSPTASPAGPAAQAAPIPTTASTATDKDYSESLLAGFSNTIRGPLQALRELITRVPAAGSLNEQQSHLIGQVIKLNSELTLMVNDLLALGQLRLQAAESSGPLRLDMLVEAAIGTRYAEFERRGQQVATEIAPGGVRVVAAEEGLGRVIGALLDNAILYSPPGAQIDIAVAQEAGEVVVTVRDTGIGLTPDELAHVFEPFYRAPGAEQLGVSGRGLGLTIARAVIEQHRGRIWATSSPGKGSTFAFSLPVQ